MPAFLAALHKLHEAHAALIAAHNHQLLHPYGRFVRLVIQIVGLG